MVEERKKWGGGGGAERIREKEIRRVGATERRINIQPFGRGSASEQHG